MSDDAANPLIEVLKSLQDIKGSVSALHEGVRPYLSSIQTTLQEFRATTEKISSDQSKARSEIMSRIDRLQETVELVRDDARVNWATAASEQSKTRGEIMSRIDRLQETVELVRDDARVNWQLLTPR